MSELIARFQDCTPARALLLSACNICEVILYSLDHQSSQGQPPTVWLYHIITKDRTQLSTHPVQNLSVYRTYNTATEVFC